MIKSDAFGMEVETVGGRTVKGVALDRAVESVGMSTMHTQLVGASGLGLQDDALAVGSGVVRDGRFAMCVVNLLSWSVQRVGRQWQGYDSL